MFAFDHVVACWKIKGNTKKIICPLKNPKADLSASVSFMVAEVPQAVKFAVHQHRIETLDQLTITYKQQFRVKPSRKPSRTSTTEFFFKNS